MRFFIALEIPQESKKELESIQNQIKKIIPQAKLTDNNKLHLTIAFIGKKPDKLKEFLIEVISRAVKEILPFEVTPAYIDGFPNLHQPKILWIGIKGDVDKLFILRERIKDELSGMLMEGEERRYVPHIAVAKFKNFVLSPQQKGKLQELSLQNFQPIKVTSVKLFESIPNHGFHQHNTLAEIKL